MDEFDRAVQLPDIEVSAKELEDYFSIMALMAVGNCTWSGVRVERILILPGSKGLFKVVIKTSDKTYIQGFEVINGN